MAGEASGQAATGRACGPCTLCCKVYDVPEAASPMGRWCGHCEPGRGCRIWETRPAQCRAFDCNWIKMNWLGEEWRPDRSKFVFTIDPASGNLMFQVDPGSPDAWRREPYYSQIRRWSAEGLARGRCALAFVNKTATLVLPDEDRRLGELGPRDRVSIAPGSDGRIAVEVKRG